jgi:hypothetical protein
VHPATGFAGSTWSYLDFFVYFSSFVRRVALSVGGGSCHINIKFKNEFTFISSSS